MVVTKVGLDSSPTLRFGRAGIPVVALAFVAAAVAAPAWLPADVVLAQGGGTATYNWSVDAVLCPTGYDNQQPDDVCFALEGDIPGPTILVEQGTGVAVNVLNNLPATLSTLPIDPGVRADLEQAWVSVHTNGVTASHAKDGIDAVPGTLFVDSSIAPATTFEYEYTANAEGAFQYHDMVATGKGREATERGLYGTVLVSPTEEDPNSWFGTPLDLHLLDKGPNGGLGLDATVSAGQTFTLASTGLGNFVWTVTLIDPSETIVGTMEIAPEITDYIIVTNSDAGTYTWIAQSPNIPGPPFEGKVVVGA